MTGRHGDLLGLRWETKTQPKSKKTIVDNIHDCSPQRPTGTSKQAGLRRLEKAADNDPKARDLLEQVLKDKCSVNAALIEMGWRRRMSLIATAINAYRKAGARQDALADLGGFIAPAIELA